MSISISLNPHEANDTRLDYREMDTIVSFTDFYFAWKKGNIENTNKRIRQYIPKNTEFNKPDDEDLREIQLRIIHNQVKNLISIHLLFSFSKIFLILHFDVEATHLFVYCFICKNAKKIIFLFYS